MADDEVLVVGLAGDCLIQHRVSTYKEERFLGLAELLNLILGSFVERSKPYGTKVEIRDGMGVISA